MRALAFSLLLIGAAAAEAAVSYRVTSATSSMQVTVDGANVRVDFLKNPDGPTLHDAVLSQDGGKTFVGVNHELKTWYTLDHSPFVLGSRMLSGLYESTARKIKWSVSKGADGAAIGTLSYLVDSRTGGGRVTAKISADVKVWTTRDLPASHWPASELFRTGFANVDAEIGGGAAMLDGFPQRIELQATRQFTGGGAPFSETGTMTVSDIQTMPSVAAGFFARPADYREQKPVIGFPAR